MYHFLLRSHIFTILVISTSGILYWFYSCIAYLNSWFDFLSNDKNKSNKAKKKKRFSQKPVRIAICRRGNVKEPSQFLPFLPEFYLFFPIFSWFSPLFPDFWQIICCQGGHSVPLPPYWLRHWLYEIGFAT